MTTLLEIDGLTVRYPTRTQGLWARPTGFVSAVDNVSFTIQRGETLGLVGESGSGKTSLGLAVLRGIEPSAGRLELSLPGHSFDIAKLRKSDLRQARRHMQMIFQDPYASLNPRMTVYDIICEPLIALGGPNGAALSRQEINARVVDIAQKCGLSRDQLKRFPHAFSGGQRQRIAIARALILNPAF
ncbi:MAG TPA: dipeptide/oligopeptide/nickel ABC transporter ATP-binding protein, partial [Nordella sp.]|nr:dipeptide/oligopeptide/nickel ABC transporter ATP-binding protein [Nordella sp.]